MKRSIITMVAAISLVAAGAAGAVGVNRIVHVQSGDRVIVNKNLSCFVAASDIVCGGAASSRISADIRSSGEIVIQAQPTSHGVYPMMFIKRAVCSSTSVCYLVIGRG